MNMQKIFIIPTALIVIFGLTLIHFNKQAASSSLEFAEKPQKDKTIAYWVAPMDPNYRRDKPGKSPMGMDLVPIYEKTAQDMESPDNGIHISAQIQANLGLKTAPVAYAEFTPIIRATGHLVYDDHKISRLQVRAEGWIEKLYVRAIGETVKKGDPLFALYSPEIATALGEYANARKRKSQSLIKFAKERLSALGLSEQSLRAALKDKKSTSSVIFHAPQDGVVTTLGIRDGSFVAKNTVAFEITNPTNLWLIADVYEADAAGLKVGASVEIIGQGTPHQEAPTWTTIDHIYPALDALSQTLRTRLNIPNPDRTLRPGQFFTVNIHEPAEMSLIIPQQAVIRLRSGNHVMIAHGKGRFEAAEVILGKSSGDNIQILHGLKEGERIVISGQFLLDSESSFTGAKLRILDHPEKKIDQHKNHNDHKPQNMNDPMNHKMEKTTDHKMEDRP